MEVIEKVKEVESNHNKEYASKSVANTGLGFGIAGTALGLLALHRNRGFGLFGNNSMPENVNINANIVIDIRKIIVLSFSILFFLLFIIYK